MTITIIGTCNTKTALCKLVEVELLLWQSNRFQYVSNIEMQILIHYIKCLTISLLLGESITLLANKKEYFLYATVAASLQKVYQYCINFTIKIQ